MKKIKNVDEVYNRLLDMLKTYAEDHGADFVNEQCNCIFPNCNHLHQDRHKSAGIVPGSQGRVLHCFTSGASGNIFTLAEEIEGLPSGGPEFLLLTLPTLAKRYNIPIEYVENDIPVSKTEKERQKALYFINDCYKIFNKNIPKVIIEYAERRKLNKGQYGGIESSEVFWQEIEKYQWTFEDVRKYLVTKGNGKPFIELLIGKKDKPRIIFPTKDKYGNIISFISRKILESDDSQKYVKGSTTNIFQKAVSLYNYNVAKKFSSVYIVEGQMDAITLRNNGIHNVIALSGCALPEDHYKLLLSNFHEIIFSLDKDSAGLDAIRRYVIKFSKNDKGVIIRIVLAEPDPDEYLSNHSIDEFLELEKLTPFEFLLYREDWSKNVYDKLSIHCIEIAKEPRVLERDRMTQFLSKISNTDIYKIKQVVNVEREKIDRDTQTKIDKVITNIEKKMKKGVDPTELLNNSLTQIENYKQSETVDKISYLDRLHTIREILKDKNKSKRIKMGKYALLEKMFYGLPRYGAFIGIPGNASHGKTTFCRNLIYELLDSNDDVGILYFSLDDALKITAPAFLSLRSGVPQWKILNDEVATTEEKKKIAWAWTWLEKSASRFLMKDIKSFSDTVTPRIINNEIIKFKESHVGVQPIVFLDSFHKLNFLDVRGLDMREHYYTIAQQLKKISWSQDTPIIATLNMRKNSGKPTESDIAESGNIIHELDAAIIAYNEMHLSDNTPWWWLKKETNEILPIVEFNVTKNKIGGIEGKIYLQLDGQKSRVDEIDPKEYFSIREQQTASSIRSKMKQTITEQSW